MRLHNTPPLTTRTALSERKYFYEILLAIFAFVFLTILSRASSVLNIASGYDESIFKLFGMAIAKGHIPYLEYVDRKGPYLFFINAIPYITHTYRFGLFFLQFACMYITTFLIFKAITTITTKARSIAAIAIMYLFYCIFYADGGQCEEYEIVFITLSLYLCYSFVRQNKSPAEHPFCYTFIYGLSFSIIAFIRLNDTATICGIVLAFAYLLIREKKIGLLFKHIGVFFAGMIFATLPVLIYYGKNHALNDMIYWSFIEGFSYNSKNFDGYVKAYSGRLFQCIPLFFTAYMARKNDKQKGTYFFPIAITITVLLYLTIGSNNFDHYFSLLMPFYAAAIAYFLSAKNFLVLCILFCHYFPPKYHNGFSNRGGFLLIAEQAAQDIFSHQKLAAFNKELQEMYRAVPKSEQNRIFAYNISHGMGFYTVNNVLPPNKGFVFTGNFEDEFEKTKDTMQYVLYQTDKDWNDTGEPLLDGYTELARAKGLKHLHGYTLHLLKKD